jgi:hypothetical protein
VTRPHWFAKRDRNQAAIVSDLRKLGAYIWDTSPLGGEVLDLLVFWRGRARPVEVKAAGCEDDLTVGEREAIQRLRLAGIEPIIAASAEDVVEAW